MVWSHEVAEWSFYSLRADILDLKNLTDGHQGLTKCRDGANSSVWWLGLLAELKHTYAMVHLSGKRADTAKGVTDLQPTAWPALEKNRPSSLWTQRLLLMIFGDTAYVINNQHSCFWLKLTFARFEIPKEVVSDNGSQFSSAEIQELAREMDFRHITSRPHYPQGSGHAERAVQTARRILLHKDPVMICHTKWLIESMENLGDRVRAGVRAGQV